MKSTHCNFKFIVMIILALMFMFITMPNFTAQNTIIWVNDNLPPAFIVDGTDQGKGIVDGVVDIYKKHLPEYRHKHIVANMPRILELMRDGANVCYAGFFKTPEREKYIYFSIPNLINYGNAIVVKKNRSGYLFGGKKTVSLQTLLQSDRLRLGVTKGRAYGGRLDQLLNQYPKNRNIFFRAGENSIQGLLEMLAADRIDYAIGFPWEISYVARKIGKQNSFSIIHIAETKGQRWFKNYIGVPKNQWGKRLIHKINKILIQVRPGKAHLYHQLKWFPKSLHQEVRRAYKRQVLSITE